MDIKTSIEMMPNFMEELEKIAKTYNNARQYALWTDVDESIDVRLRGLIQDQLSYMENLLDDSEHVSSSVRERYRFSRDTLPEKIKYLDSLVFDDDNWNRFSQKLKSRMELQLPLQLT